MGMQTKYIKEQDIWIEIPEMNDYFQFDIDEKPGSASKIILNKKKFHRYFPVDSKVDVYYKELVTNKFSNNFSAIINYEKIPLIKIILGQNLAQPSIENISESIKELKSFENGLLEIKLQQIAELKRFS